MINHRISELEGISDQLEQHIYLMSEDNMLRKVKSCTRQASDRVKIRSQPQQSKSSHFSNGKNRIGLTKPPGPYCVLYTGKRGIAAIERRG